MDGSLFVLLLSALFWSSSALSRQYHYINVRKSWPEAQSYCRVKYTDLATVDTMDDVNRLVNIVDSGYSGSVWIGLKRGTQQHWVWVWIGLSQDSWEWSDQWNLSFRYWTEGQPSQSSGFDCVGMSTTNSGKWVNKSCDLKHPFICHEEDKIIRKQIVRLKLSCNDKCTLNDPSLQTAIMNKISEKLKSVGLESNSKMVKKRDRSVKNSCKRSIL